MVGRAARGRNLGAGFELSELSMQPVAQVSAGLERRPDVDRSLFSV
jgi:hypothetical protein